MRPRVTPVIWEGLFSSTFKKWQRRGREEGLGMACYASYIIIYLQTPEAAVSKEESCDSLFPIDQFEDIIPEFYTTLIIQYFNPIHA